METLNQLFFKLRQIVHRRSSPANGLPDGFNLYDPNFRFPAFFTNPYEEKAFDGLNLLLELGHPFEFAFGGRSYRIAKAGSSQYVSLWEDGVEQPFDSLTELMEGAILGGRTFEECFDQLPLGDFL